MDNAILVVLDESLKDHGFSEEKVKDRLTIHFQKGSNGGGDVEKVLYPLSSASPSKAIVVFSDKCDIGRLTAYEHRVKFADNKAIRVTVEPLPQVFNNIRVEVNSFYMNLLPRDQTDIFRHRMSPQTKVMCPDNNGGMSLQVQNVDDLQQATNLLFNAIGLDRHQQAGERQETNIVDEEEQHLSIRQRMVNSSPQRGQSKPQQKKIAAVFSGDDGTNESSFSKATKKDTQTDRGLMSGDYRNAQSTSGSARDSTQKDIAKSQDGAKSGDDVTDEPSFSKATKKDTQTDRGLMSGDRNAQTTSPSARDSTQKDRAKLAEFTYAKSDRNSYQKDGAKSQEYIYGQSTSQFDRDSMWNDQAIMPTNKDTDSQPTSQYNKDRERKNHNISHRDMEANSAQKQSGPFTVSPLLYQYLVKKHGEEFRKIEKQHEVIIDKVDQVDSNNDLMGIAGVNEKVSMEHLIQAEDMFIDLYQQYFNMYSVRKHVLNSEVPVGRLHKACERISYDFPDILINTDIEGEFAFVGKTDEVSQALDVFRKEAGLNRSRRLKGKDVDESSETGNGTEYGLGENSYKGGDIKYLQSGARPRTNRQHHNQWPNTSTAGTDNSFWTDGGVEILVEQKDITHQTTDVIVNASNGSLQHSGGVAFAISKAAGPQLQQECNDILGYNYLTEGECVATKGYNLRCTYVMHVVGPTSSSGQSLEKFEQKLHATFVNCLNEISKLPDVRTIAIPLVSSGVVGGPKGVCAAALVDALLQCFDKPGSSRIQKAFLVNKDLDATKALKEALRKKKDLLMNRMNGNDDTQPMEVDYDEGSNHVLSSPHSVDATPTSDNSDKSISSEWEYSKHPSNRSQRKTFQSKAGMRITVAQDCIANCGRVDVVINVSSEISFQTGVAKEIADAAGDGLLREFQEENNAKPFSFSNYQIVVTRGYKLHCGKVLHILIPKRYIGQSQKAVSDKVHKAVRKCLEYAELTLKSQSLMIPMGNYDGGNHTPEIYANAIAKALMDFCIGPVDNLRHVNVVHPKSEMYVAIQSAFEEYFESDVKNDAHYSISSKGASADQRTTSLNKDGSKRSRKLSDDDDDWGSTKDMKGDTSDDEDEEEKKCPICLEDFKGSTDLKVLDECKHKFCKECIDKAMAVKPVCPMCGKVYGVMKGHQPDGTMRDSTSNYTHLPGYPGCGCITIRYNFNSGTQGKNHPNPGKYYTGASRTAYLPNNAEGRKVLALLKKAFNARLTFTIGTSVTSGATDVVTWNDIHHKTSTHGGTQSFGYPDETYLKRVTEELAAKGIK